jgi:hypothetical protein
MQVSMGGPYAPGEPVQALAINSGVSGKLIAERRMLSEAVAAINKSGAFGPQREPSFFVDPASRRLVVQSWRTSFEAGPGYCPAAGFTEGVSHRGWAPGNSGL